jgi:hypothetical protein
MIEVKILKGVHSGIEEARKLLPLIEKCHVFSPEEAFPPIQIIERLEKDLEGYISRGDSRSKFKRWIDDQWPIKNGAPDQGSMEYMHRTIDYLFRNRIFAWFAERYSPEEYRDMELLESEKNRLQLDACTALLDGDIVGHYTPHEDYLEKFAEQVRLRDVNIGENLSTSEERIRDRFPGLNQVNPLRYVVSIGAGHNPELYVPFPVDVIDTSNGYGLDSPQNKSVVAYMDGVRGDDLKVLMLREGIWWLKYHRINPLSIDDEEIDTMDIERMTDTIRSHLIK